MFLESKNCLPGKEQYMFYTSRTTGKECLQYDYREKSGKLHSTVICLKPDRKKELSPEEAIEKARKNCDYGL